jgi:hypothetical protein
MSYLFLVFLVLNGISLFAGTKKNCTAISEGSKVDLSNKFGPTRDQDSVGWCYGYVAADLLDYHFRKDSILKGTPDQDNMVSASGISLLYNSSVRELNLGMSSTYLSMARKIRQDEVEIDEKLTRTIESLQGLPSESKSLTSALAEAQFVLNHDNSDLYYLKYLFEEIEGEIQETQKSKKFQKAFSTLKILIGKKISINRLKNKIDNAFDDPELNEQEGGHIAEAITLALNKGLCSEKEIPSSDVKISKELAGLINEIKDYVWEQYQIGLRVDRGRVNLKDLWHMLFRLNVAKIESAGESDVEGAALCEECKAGKGSEKISSLLGVLDPKFFSMSWDLLDGYLSKKCLKKRPVKSGEYYPDEKAYRDYDSSDDADIRKRILENLNKKKPVGVGYDSKILTNPIEFLKARQGSIEESDSYHASVIVGYKEGCGGELSYIVRNSWGADSCKEIKKVVSSEIDTPKSFGYRSCINKCKTGQCASFCKRKYRNKNIPNKGILDCDKNGNYIVSAEYFEKSVVSLTTMEKR